MNKFFNLKRRRADLLSRTTSAEKSVSKTLTAIGITHKIQYLIKTPRMNYFADIYIPSLRLVLELDGKYHDTSRQHRLDRNRSANIRKMGIAVYRLPNRKAYDASAICAKINTRKRALSGLK